MDSGRGVGLSMVAEVTNGMEQIFEKSQVICERT